MKGQDFQLEEFHVSEAVSLSFQSLDLVVGPFQGTCRYPMVEPGQKPEFNEYTVVLKGSLKIRTKNEEFIVSEGMAILTSKSEWVQYSSPFSGGAEYIAICLPAFSPEIVHRD